MVKNGASSALGSLPPYRRTRRTTVLLLAVALGTSGAFHAVGAQADPKPSVDAVQRQVDALSARADVAVEAFDQAKLALASAQQRSGVAQARVRREQAAFDTLRASLAGVISSAYREGGTDVVMSLVGGAGTPATFLERSVSLDRLARGTADQLAALATARHRLTAAQATAADELHAQQAVERQLAARRADILATLGRQKALLSGLRAQDRARLDAMRSAELRASRDRTSYATYSGPASGQAAIAVQEAYRKLGSPYEWAAAGPDRFDCSGLTMWVWGKAGVSLPHSAEAQFGSGRPVSRADIQPGDLTFYGSPIHHVGIYIGGGQMISAPHTGDVVKIQAAFRSDYVGAARP